MENGRKTSWAWALLLLFASLAAVAALAFLFPEPERVSGAPLPEHPGMARGCGATAQGWLFELLAALFGLLVLAALFTLAAFGCRRAGRLGPARWPLLAAALAAGAALGAVLIAYHLGRGDPDPDLWLALPPPTALVLFLFWPAQLALVAAFEYFFERWFWRPEDERRLRELLETGVRPGEPRRQ